jgi:hypothetical protein
MLLSIAVLPLANLPVITGTRWTASTLMIASYFLQNHRGPNATTQCLPKRLNPHCPKMKRTTMPRMTLRTHLLPCVEPPERGESPLDMVKGAICFHHAKWLHYGRTAKLCHPSLPPYHLQYSPLALPDQRLRYRLIPRVRVLPLSPQPLKRHRISLVYFGALLGGRQWTLKPT